MDGKSDKERCTKGCKRALSLTEAADATTSEPKKARNEMIFTDLNEDCQFEVFKYLNIEDLSSAANTVKCMVNPARDVFTKFYGNKMVPVSNECALKSVPVLKRFGDLINKLEVNYSVSHRYDLQLDKAIVTFCQDTLVELTLIDIDKDVFHESKTPFEKVIKVRFDGGFGVNIIRRFNELFPNAQSLDLVDMQFKSQEDSKCIEQRFPALTHLGIESSMRIADIYLTDNALTVCGVIDNSKTITFIVGNLKKAMELNPQLVSLKLKHGQDLKFMMNPNAVLRLPNISNSLMQLESLHVDVTQGRQFLLGGLRNETASFDHLTKLTVDFDLILNVSGIVATQLETLVLNRTGEFPLNGLVTKILSSNKDIKDLQLLGSWENNFDPKELLKDLSKLQRLKIECEMDYRQLVWIFANCNELKEFSVQKIDDVSMEQLLGFMERMNFGWTVKANESGPDSWTAFEKK